MIDLAEIMAFCVGFVAGVALVFFANKTERKESQIQAQAYKRKVDSMLAEANERIAESNEKIANLERELVVKQNVANSLNEKVNRLNNTIKRLRSL